jgi:DEAD/DEAH box helicase domain-containing protein
MIENKTMEHVRNVIEDCGYLICDRHTMPGRNPIFSPSPARLHESLREKLRQLYPNGLYKHQADAIDAILDGKDVCLATSTASGKSLVFMTASIDLLLRDPSAKILALYPARALIKDQLCKWQEIAGHCDISVGFIDGSVPLEMRTDILASSRVVLMTPDVAHAWLMSHLDDARVRFFMRQIRMAILDEAHVYEGVFGTNMAYFLRRFVAAAGNLQFVCSTATIARADDFVTKLTGRDFRLFNGADDASARPVKTIFLCRTTSGDAFENAAFLLQRLAQIDGSRFLAFGDSRKMVERFVAALSRFQEKGASMDGQPSSQTSENSDDVEEQDVGEDGNQRVLPYRAGYEDDDRKAIQKALSQGCLTGVVSTSALELGLDIGDIDTVVLLNPPPSGKSFYQRLGRAGRRRPALCILLDDQDKIQSLHDYISSPIEPNWLYLDNRYIQFANVLCAAKEMSFFGKSLSEPSFKTLPPSFSRWLENELDPKAVVPTDLYPLKQRGQSDPHHEFPMRSAMEQEFRVVDINGSAIGRLTLSQSQREGYPGAIYYYMARAHRVVGFNWRKGEIKVRRVKQWTTTPIAQSVVFPRFQGGMLGLFRSKDGFMSEVEVQVSERVLGFVENRGRTKVRHQYGPASEYYGSPINRFFSTTGVCWFFESGTVLSEAAVHAIVEAFSRVCGIQTWDLGIGSFFSREYPSSGGSQGWCVYDATNGSLRLTKMLAERIEEVLTAAKSSCDPNDTNLQDSLIEFSQLVSNLAPVPSIPNMLLDLQTDWSTVIASGEKAVYTGIDGAQEVEVMQYRFTPCGPMYELKSPSSNCRWMVASATVQPINGLTLMTKLNLITGESLEQR